MPWERKVPHSCGLKGREIFWQPTSAINASITGSSRFKRSFVPSSRPMRSSLTNATFGIEKPLATFQAATLCHLLHPGHRPSALALGWDLSARWAGRPLSRPLGTTSPKFVPGLPPVGGRFLRPLTRTAEKPGTDVGDVARKPAASTLPCRGVDVD
jgi:hypothetical protein